MKVREGSIVIVRGGFGVDPPAVVKVYRVAQKNNQPVFDYEGNKWAYFNQIQKVIRY